MTWTKAASFVTPIRLVTGAVALLATASLVCYLIVDGPMMERLSNQPIFWHRIDWIDAFRALGSAQVPIWLAALFAVVTRRTRPLVVIVLALILSSAMVIPLKVVTPRLRPIAVLRIRDGMMSPQTLRFHAKASFPSGDASTAFAVATAVTTTVSGVWWPFLYTGATAIGLLRVTSMRHYPSDVCAGAAIGILAGYLAFRLCKAYPRLALPDLPVLSVWRGLSAAVVLVVPLLLVLFDRGSPFPIFLRFNGIPIAVICVVLLIRDRRRQGEGSLPPVAPGKDRSL